MIRTTIHELWTYYWQRRLTQRVLTEMRLEVKRLRMVHDPAALSMADYLNEFVKQIEKGQR